MPFFAAKKTSASAAGAGDHLSALMLMARAPDCSHGQWEVM